MRRWAAATLIALSCFTQVTDESALRGLAERYFAAYAKEDVAEFFALWSASSPELASRRATMGRILAAEDFSFSNLTVSKIKIAGASATQRIVVDRTARNARLNQSRTGRMNLNLHWLKEGTEWKLWRDAPAVADLATELSQVPSETEAAALLDAEPELITGELEQLLFGHADRFFTRNDYAGALKALRAALHVAERLGHQAEAATAWYNLGNIYFQQARFSLALDAYQRSLRIEEELGRHEEVARSLLSLGLVHAVEGRTEEGFAHYAKSLAISESRQDTRVVANTLERIGNLHEAQGNYTEAADYYLRSVKLRDPARDRAVIATTLINLGKAYYDQGQDGPALEYYQQALARLGSRDDYANRAHALHSVANIYYGQGNFSLALEHYQQSLKAVEGTGDRHSTSGALLGIGLIYSLQGYGTLALETYRRNLALWQTQSVPGETAAAHQKVGGVHFWHREYEQALDHYRQALALRQSHGDAEALGWALLDVGLVYAAQEAYAPALEHYQRGREAFEKAGDRAGVGAVLLSTGLIRYAQNDFAASLELADQAAALARQSGDTEALWQARYRAGKAHYRLEQPAPARRAFAEAINAIETLRPQPAGGQQPRFFESKLSPYLAMVDLLVSQNQAVEALAFAERAKARALLAVLHSGRARITKGMTPTEQEREGKLLGDLTTLQNQISRAREQQAPDRQRLETLGLRLQRARSAYQVFQQRLFAAHPDLRVFRGEGPPLGVAQAGALAADPRRVILQYVETDEAIYLFALTGGQGAGRRGKPASPAAPRLYAYALNLSRADLAARVGLFRQSIAAREAGVEAQARELYDLLLAPAREQLAGRAHVVIVPDGTLWRLPFQALRADDQHYLLERHAVSYAPSLTALSHVSRARPDPRVHPPDAQTLLAVANPTSGRVATDRLKAMLHSEQVAPAPDGGHEVSALRQLYGEGQIRVLSGPEADAERVRDGARRSRTIHLAARCALSEASPLFSIVALAPGEDEEKEDGLLSVASLMQWESRAELVVLPLCAAVMPGAELGRALTGLSWGFYVAGSPTVLVSQWTVEPSGSADLMISFHRRLKAGASKAKAWQEAVTQTPRDGEHRHPYYWAGYAILGRGN